MYISEWEWTDEIVEHIARHGVSVKNILDTWRLSPKFRRNKKDRGASHQMLGPDVGGRYFAVFIREDDVHCGRWRVITARVATAAEVTWWKRS